MLLAILILSFANLVIGVARGWMIYNQLQFIEMELRAVRASVSEMELRRAGDWQRAPHDRANFLSELKKLSPEQLAAYLSALKYHAGGEA